MNRRLSLAELARRRKVQVELEASPRACLTLLEDLPHPDAPPRHLVTSWRARAGDALRRLADRVDPYGKPL